MIKQNQYHPQSVSHPGSTLAEKLEEIGMGIKEFALRTGKPEKTIIAVVNGGSSITPDMAVQFEQVLKIPAHFWLNRQQHYDEYLARKKQKEILPQTVKWAKAFPLKAIIALGWIEKANSAEEQALRLLEFFGVSSHIAWENYYLKSELKVQFRISLYHAKDPHALSAWLRHGEIQAVSLKTAEYSERKFKDTLPDIKKLMAKHPKSFFKKLQSLCSDAGVKVVHTPCLPGTPISGSTRWLNDTPMIQLTGRFKRNDSFWFTFFHEAGHILLHGKKDIFLENVDYSDKDMQKEKEANNFAQEWVLSADEKAEILENKIITPKDIIVYAKKFGTHPAMIIGQLQHDNLIPYHVGREFIEPVELDENGECD